jgi:hypothetical protein
MLSQQRQTGVLETLSPSRFRLGYWKALAESWQSISLPGRINKVVVAG